MIFYNVVTRILIFTIGFFLVAALPLTSVFQIPNVRLIFFGFTTICIIPLILGGLQIRVSNDFYISLLFLFSIISSYLFTRAPDYAFIKITQIIGYFYVLPFIIYVLVNNRKQEEYLILGLFGSGILLNIALFKFAGDPISVLNTAGRFFRLKLGDEANPIITARYLGIAAIVAIYYSIAKENKLVKLIALATFLTSSTYMVSTGSKGPIASLVASIYVIAYFSSKYRKIILVLSTLIILALLFVFLTVIPDSFFEQRFTSKVDNLSGRLPVISETLYYLYQKAGIIQLIFGHGIGDFGYYLTGKDIRMYPHNIFIEILFETGLFGLFTYIWWIIVPALHFIKTNKGLPDHIGALFLGIYVFSIINAQFSGDLPANFFIPIFGSLILSHIFINKSQTKL